MRESKIGISQCCNADVKVEGNTTLFYRCIKCGKPCDTKRESKSDEVRKILKSYSEELQEELNKGWVNEQTIIESEKEILSWHFAEIEKLKHDHEILVNTILESKEKMLDEVLNSKKYICLNRSQRLSIEPLCSKCQYKKKCKWKDFKKKISELREGK